MNSSSGRIGPGGLERNCRSCRAVGPVSDGMPDPQVLQTWFGLKLPGKSALRCIQFFLFVSFGLQITSTWDSARARKETLRSLPMVNLKAVKLKLQCGRRRFTEIMKTRWRHICLPNHLAAYFSQMKHRKNICRRAAFQECNVCSRHVACH
jgi:hypothetical protein